MVVEPERRDQQDIFGRGVDLIRCRAHDFGVRQAFEHGFRAGRGAIEDARKTLPQLAVAREDVDEVAVQEPVFPHALEHEVQLQPDILEVRQAAFGNRQRVVHARLVAHEQPFDDVILVAVVIVQVARADPEFVGDVIGGDVRLTLRVEHRQGGVEDAFASLFRRHRRAQAVSRAIS